VEQQLEALAGRELALGVLRGDALGAAAQAGGGAFLVELTDDVVHDKSPGPPVGTGGLHVDESRYPKSWWAAAAGVMRPAATARRTASRCWRTCGCWRKRPRRPLSSSAHIQSTAWPARFAARPPPAVM